jgi:hypothetical protein
MRTEFTPRELARFWKHVAKGGDACWLWTGSVRPDGYGQVTLGGRNNLVPRAMWVITNGPIPGGLNVCHSCDNPTCCNPAHLFLGTQQANVLDMVAKRRHAIGAKHGLSKLTEAQVVEMRNRHAQGERVGVLAKNYGVSPATVCRVVHRNGWLHV